MKRTIKIRTRGPERIETVEVEFPYFRKHDVGDDYSSVYYTRIEADGRRYEIHVNGDDEYGLQIRPPRPTYGHGDLFPWGSGSDLDYELGRGEHALTQAEFDVALAKARAFLARFPDGSATG